MEIIYATLARTGLDLSGLTVLTEAATGAYCVTPVIAALANADQVYALTRPSGYGSVAEVERCTNELTSLAGIKDRVEIITAIKDDVLARADIATNSGHLRPIDRSIISKLPQHCVIALMFETWEFRTSDIDVAAARERSIPIVGVNERHPAVDVFSYLGPLCVNMLHNAGIPVYGSRIALLCDNDFGYFVARSLTGLGADVRSFSQVDALEHGHWDAIVLALQPAAGPRIDATGAAQIARVAPNAVIAQLWGDADRAAIASMKLNIWPPHAPLPGHMGVLLSAIGPEPIIRLQTGGLRAAEWVYRSKPIEAGGIAEIL
ncbi:MAG: hypothetical protein L0Y50_00415 [Beijerinckiaceae bacterium]|nr:hypothetical protein [Beijerinckiaceae bacterium]MCI0734735.1 hypothetical protein [Beijerinckiaceae bacterium]